MTSTPRRVLLAHGAGGRLTRDLVARTFLPALTNPHLASLSDAAVLPQMPPGRPAMTTDGFVVDPPVFAGGDLGYLSVCGTVNDLAMAGARPLWLTWALILEEGAERTLIETCLSGTARAAKESGVDIVAGDTKVVPKGKGDRIYAVTAGLGVVPPGRDVGDHRIEPGDVIIASGTLGDHGATIMAERHGIGGEELRSDCAPVNGQVESLFEAGLTVHSLHDPTRGGAIAVCNEVADRSEARIVLSEADIPISPQSRAVCELLGLEVLGLACEGRFLAWVPEDQAEHALSTLHADPGARGAAVIGRVEERLPDQLPVILETRVGGRRPLDYLSGSELPRIC